MRTVDERFWSKVAVTPSCWLWQAATSTGYGVFRPTPPELVKAHRWAYERLVGLIPAGMQVDHLCRIRRCVNPGHLEVVTQAENIRRGQAGWHMKEKAAQRTHCKRGHEFTPENTKVVRGGGRQCRECGNAARRKGAPRPRRRVA